MVASVIGYLGVILTANGLNVLGIVSGLSLTILIAGVMYGRRVLNGTIWNLDIDSLHVETNPDYLPRNNTTYCNIYVADLVNMRFGYGSTYRGRLRNHLRDKYPLPVQLSDDVWLDANRMIQWLRGQLTGSGPNAQDRGWRQVSLREAIEYANQGYPTLAAWECSDDSDPGHLAAVRAGNLADVPLRELQIAQSGKSNFSCGALQAGFGDREPIEFFVMLA